MTDITETQAVSEEAKSEEVNAATPEGDLAEIDEALSHIEEKGTTVKPATESAKDAASATEEELRMRRIEMGIKRARRQREMGIKELEREYLGVAVIPITLALNDMGIASSAARFLGMVDRTLWIFKTRGGRYMPPEDVRDTIELIISKANAYTEGSSNALSSVRALHASKYEESLDEWLTPSYPRAALEKPFHAKNAICVKLAKSLQEWDKATATLIELEFNGAADSEQVAELSRMERRLFNDLAHFCRMALNGLRGVVEGKAFPKGLIADKDEKEENTGS